MLKKIKQYLQIIKALLPLTQYSCRIAEVNMHSQEVIIHIKNKGIFLKCSLSEAIAGSSIINKLSPLEACWLGGYYGRALRASNDHGIALKKVKKMSFLLKKSKTLYQIAFQERTGEIGYLNQKNKEIFVEHPITIATNEHIITYFNSSQACYIGILAGMLIERISNKKFRLNDANIILKKPPKLRIVE